MATIRQYNIGSLYHDIEVAPPLRQPDNPVWYAYSLWWTLCDIMKEIATSDNPTCAWSIVVWHHIWIYTEKPTMRQYNISLLYDKIKVLRHSGKPTIWYDSIMVYGKLWHYERYTDTRQYDMPHIWVFYEVTHGYADLPTIRQNITGLSCYELEVVPVLRQPDNPA